jgi:arylsulfatase A-like enzyme
MISSIKSFAFTLAAVTSLSAAPPNLIIILTDDMGYSDPGCYGGEISTPAIDKLAREGIRLTRFQNCGMCVVSRASMLTGQWWPRGLRDFKSMPLLSEKLQTTGYRTALIGKWHLPGQPLDRGFDHFFGFLDGFADHFTGSKSYRLDRKPFTEFGPGYYSSDVFTDRAINFIKAPGDQEKPFFLYLSYQAPHNPLQAPKADILKYRGKYLDGWQAVREARFRRQKEMGIVPADAVLPAYPKNLPDWKSLTPEQRDLEDLRMAVYAAMVERMDQGIGRLVKALEESGKANNTQILFMSDNGADSFSVVDQAMLKQGKLPGDPASNWQPGTGWAHASVTPWRLYKISQHGGGITTGAVAWRGGKTNGPPGRIDASPIHMVDVMPTFLEIANPAARIEVAGESFASLLRGKPWQRKGPLFFQYMDNRAIRSAEWTLAEVDGTGWELFNTRTDPLETRNLAKSNPELVATMSQRWLKWWKDESGKPAYQPESTGDSPHYKPQGDKGSGKIYTPSAMPARLADRYPLPQ